MAISTVEQYEIIRTSIKSNVNTIRHLVMQIDTLNQMVLEMEDETTKSNFENSIRGLYHTINILIDETDKLLNESVTFANSSNLVS